MRVLAGLVAGFFRFWYDFIIGDSWEIAAGVVIALVASVFAVRATALPEHALPLLLAGVLMLVLVLSVVVELRRKLAKG